MTLKWRELRDGVVYANLNEDYSLIVSTIETKNGDTYKTYDVEFNDYATACRKYLQKIQLKTNWSDHTVREITVQTSAYGALDAGEILRVADGLREAAEVAEILKDYFNL